jgi:hypothetical protein
MPPRARVTSPIAAITLQEIRAMLRFVRRSHRKHLLPRLEAFERVVDAWSIVPPSTGLRAFTMIQIAGFRAEALAMLGTPLTCATAPDWQIPAP